MMTFSFQRYASDGSSVEVTLPAVYEVCPTCRGNGTHVNPAIDGNGLSQEDFAEDEDFREAYFRGDYDVTCGECGGKRVVLVPDVGRADPAVLAEYLDQKYEVEKMNAEDAYTRRMENGGRFD